MNGDMGCLQELREVQVQYLVQQEYHCLELGQDWHQEPGLEVLDSTDPQTGHYQCEIIITSNQ